MIGALKLRRGYLQSTSRVLFEALVRRPCQGLVEISQGLRLIVPTLTEAVRSAIATQLSDAARDRLWEGLHRIGSGCRKVRWAVILLVTVAGWKGTGLLVTVASVLTVVV